MSTKIAPFYIHHALHGSNCQHLTLYVILVYLQCPWKQTVYNTNAPCLSQQDPQINYVYFSSKSKVAERNRQTDQNNMHLITWYWVIQNYTVNECFTNMWKSTLQKTLTKVYVDVQWEIVLNLQATQEAMITIERNLFWSVSFWFILQLLCSVQ